MNPISDAPTNRQLAAVARRAAETIQQRGKATGRAQDHLGRVCAIGALSDAARAEGYEPASAALLIAERCRDLHPLQQLGVVDWSDLPTTTEQDIAKVFLQVADEIEVAP